MCNKILVILYELWNDDCYYNNNNQCELECKDVENDGKVMESHTNYLNYIL